MHLVLKADPRKDVYEDQGAIEQGRAAPAISVEGLIGATVIGVTPDSKNEIEACELVSRAFRTAGVFFAVECKVVSTEITASGSPELVAAE